jgi:Putative adhesin
MELPPHPSRSGLEERPDMRVRTDVLFLAALAAVLSGCDLDEIASFGNAHAFEKDFHQSYPLKSGGRLSLESFNGPVEIGGWDQDKVEIDAVQYASTERLRDAIQIDVVASGDSVQIRTIRPVDSRGNMGVKYVIKAPRKVNLDHIVTSNGQIKVSSLEGMLRVRTTNGGVTASKVRGELDVQTSNGTVEVTDLDGPATIRTTNGRVWADGIRGALQASTSNGGIQARLHQPEPHRPVKLATTNGGIELTMDSLEDNEVRATTSNGGITLKLPSRIGARVRARTSQSSIHTDFDVHREDLDGRNRLDGIIGAGGPTLELTTSNGSIRLLKL